MLVGRGYVLEKGKIYDASESIFRPFPERKQQNSWRYFSAKYRKETDTFIVSSTEYFLLLQQEKEKNCIDYPYVSESFDKDMKEIIVPTLKAIRKDGLNKSRKQILRNFFLKYGTHMSFRTPIGKFVEVRLKKPSDWDRTVEHKENCVARAIEYASQGEKAAESWIKDHPDVEIEVLDGKTMSLIEFSRVTKEWNEKLYPLPLEREYLAAISHIAKEYVSGEEFLHFYQALESMNS